MRRLGPLVLLVLGLLAPVAKADDPALELRWHLDGNVGNSTPDSSLEKRPGSPVSPVPGRFSGAAFDYAGTNVAGPTGFPAAQQLTVLAWVRNAGNPTAGGVQGWIVNSDADSEGPCTGDPFYGLRVAPDGSVAFAGSDGVTTTLSPAASSAAIWNGQWHALAGQRAADGRVHLFVDGTEVGTGTVQGGIYYAPGVPNVAVGTRAGYCNDPTGQRYKGFVDEVRLYSRALTPTEITYLAASPGDVRPRDLPIPPAAQAGAVAQYHLESPSAITDSSGNGLNGTPASITDQPNGRFGHAVTIPTAFNTGIHVDGNPLLAPRAFTVSTWIRKAGAPPANAPIVGRGAGSPDCSGQTWKLGVDGSGRVLFSVSLVGPDGAQQYVQTRSIDTRPGKPQIFDGQWHALTATYADGVATLFLDGKVAAGLPDGLTVSSAPVGQGGAEEIDYVRSTQSDKLGIGRYPANCSVAGFGGDIDETQVFGHVLDDAQIAALSSSTATTAPALPAPEATPNAAAEPEPGLSVKWHLDAVQNGFTPDSSGHGLDGRVDAVQTDDDGRFGQALTAPAGEVNTPVGLGTLRSSRLEPNVFTLQAWVKDDQIDRGPIISYGADGCSTDYGWALKGTEATDAPGIEFRVTGFDPGIRVRSNGDIWNGKWRAVTVVSTGAQLRLYVDGVLQDNPVNATVPYPDAVRAGLRLFDKRTCLAAQTHYHGSVDEVRLYRRALTQDEITHLTQVGVNTPPTLPIPLGPKNTARPTLSGEPRIGSVLTCNQGAWTPAPTSYVYVWERAPHGTGDGSSSWAAIDNAVGKQYTLQPADDGSRVRCRETALNNDGQGEAVSASVQADTDVPSGGNAPTITGVPVAPRVLECVPGTGYLHGPEFGFQWTRNGNAIAGATERRYQLNASRRDDSAQIFDPDGDGGKLIGCVVTPRNDLGSAGAVASPDVLAVDDVPFPTGKAKVSGLNVANPLASKLRCDRGTFLDDYVTRGAEYGDQYRWKSEGVEITGATGREYTPDAPKLGRAITCEVAATNPDGTGRFSSGEDLFIPLPGGSTAGRIETVYRKNRNDPINMLATTDAYRAKAKALFVRLQTQQLDAVAAACKTPQGMKNQQAVPPTVSVPFFTFNIAPTLNPYQQCFVLNYQRPLVQLTDSGWYYFGNGCANRGPYVYTCNPLGLAVQTVSAATADALPVAEQDELKGVTPATVLWDVDNDGRTDIACPGSAPVIRGNFDIGRYQPRAVIVDNDSATTGLYTSLQTQFDFPDTGAVTSGGVVRKGAKRTPLQPMWCRSSITPPPDPKVGPCTSNGVIGRVTISGNLCPMNVRAINDDALKGLPSDLQDVVKTAADVINKAEAEQEKAQPGYSAGQHRRFSLMARALPTDADRAVAATATNTAAAIAGVSTAANEAAAGGSAVQKKLDGAFKDLEKKVPSLNPDKTGFATDQIYTAAGTMSVNGVQIKPDSLKIPTLIVPSDVGEALPGVKQMTILSQDADAYLKAPIDAAKKTGNIALNEGKKQFKKVVDDQIGKADKLLADNVDLSKLGDKVDLGPFKLTGSTAKVELNDDGTATLHAVARLPGLTNAVAPPSRPDEKAGDPISIAVDLNGDLSGRIRLQGLKLKVPKAYLVGVQLSKLNLTYNDKGLDVSGLITFPLSGGDGIEIKNFRLGANGEFLGINVAYLAGAGKGIQVAPGVFLVKIGGGFQTKPYEISGQAAISAGLPASGAGCPTVGIDGGVTFHWNPTPLFLQIKGTVVIVCIPLANLDFYVDDTGWVKAHGDWGLDIPLIKLKADVNGEFVTSPRNVWQIDAKGTAEFDFFPFDEIALKGVLSNRGVAACGSIRINAPDPFPGHVTLAGGAAIRFNGGHPPLTYPELLANIRAFVGCDIDDYAPIRSVRVGRQSTAPQTFTLGKGGTSLSLEGAGAAPRVILTDPKGKRYDYSEAEHGKLVDGTFGTRIDSEDRTVALLPYATPGQWKAEVAPGSTPILRIQSADLLPAPKVKARVTGKGARRTLRYSVAKIPGQEVTFVETATSGHKVLKTVTGGGTGKVRYTLGETRSAKRTIEAQVYQGGIPRDRLEVAHYVAPNAAVRRARVRIRRVGSAATVTWSKIAVATRYDVRVTYGDGRRVLLEPAGRARTVRVPGVGKRGAVRVAVVAYTVTGRTSTGTKRLKAVKKAAKGKHRKKGKKRT